MSEVNLANGFSLYYDNGRLIGICSPLAQSCRYINSPSTTTEVAAATKSQPEPKPAPAPAENPPTTVAQERGMMGLLFAGNSRITGCGGGDLGPSDNIKQMAGDAGKNITPESDATTETENEEAKAVELSSDQIFSVSGTGERYLASSIENISADFYANGLADVKALYITIESDPTLIDPALECVPGMINTNSLTYIEDAKLPFTRLPVKVKSYTIIDQKTGVTYSSKSDLGNSTVEALCQDVDSGAVIGQSGSSYEIKIDPALYDPNVNPDLTDINQLRFKASVVLEIDATNAVPQQTYMIFLRVKLRVDN
jgi:hypothetical protein